MNFLAHEINNTEFSNIYIWQQMHLKLKSFTTQVNWNAEEGIIHWFFVSKSVEYHTLDSDLFVYTHGHTLYHCQNKRWKYTLNLVWHTGGYSHTKLWYEDHINMQGRPTLPHINLPPYLITATYRDCTMARQGAADKARPCLSGLVEVWGGVAQPLSPSCNEFH